jgi:hypothetical protein
MNRLHGIATAMVVVISASASTHFSVGAVVSFPCTVSPSTSTSAVSCSAPQSGETAQVSYVTDSDNGDMLMTVVF